MSRPNPVVEFPIWPDDPQVASLLDILRSALGRVTSLVDLTLLTVPAGHGVAAGATVSVAGTRRVINTADAAIDQARLIVHGVTAAGAAITIEVYDVTAAAVLCTTTVTVALGTNVGAWTALAPFNSDHTIELRVVGNGVNAQTLYSAELQLRTTRFTH